RWRVAALAPGGRVERVDALALRDKHDGTCRGEGARAERHVPALRARGEVEAKHAVLARHHDGAAFDHERTERARVLHAPGRAAGDRIEGGGAWGVGGLVGVEGRAR